MVALIVNIRDFMNSLDEENPGYGPDFEVGGLETVDDYIVDDDRIDYDDDMAAGVGDDPQPDQDVDVTELDRSAYPKTAENAENPSPQQCENTDISL